MGFRLEKYNDNTCNLIVSFQGNTNSNVYFAGNNIDDAINHFDLYIENNTNNTIGMIFDEEFRKKGHDCKIHEIYTTKIKGPKSSKNQRIMDQEATIVNNIVFPKAGLYPPLHRISQFMNDFTRYDSKLQTKQHDDAPDSVAMYSDKCIYVKKTRFSQITGLNKSLLWQ